MFAYGTFAELTFAESAPEAADEAQSLTPALFTNTNVFHGPTVNRGTVTLTPALYTDADTFHSPTVNRGAVTLTPALYVDADTFYQPTITVGGVALEPALFIDGDTFYSPTVAGATVTLLPSLYQNDNTFYEITVEIGGLLHPSHDKLSPLRKKARGRTPQSVHDELRRAEEKRQKAEERKRARKPKVVEVPVEMPAGQTVFDKAALAKIEAATQDLALAAAEKIAKDARRQAEIEEQNRIALAKAKDEEDALIVLLLAA